MKTYLIHLLLLLATTVQAQQEEIIKIEFQSLSRGYFENVSITSDSLIIRTSKNRGTDEIVSKEKFSKKDWKRLLNDLDHTALAEIPELKSPTMKRTYDGARHSMIKITTNTNSYEHLFDDEQPHASLNKLMQCVILIRDRK